MFNFANPKAARRWEEVHEKNEAPKSGKALAQSATEELLSRARASYSKDRSPELATGGGLPSPPKGGWDDAAEATPVDRDAAAAARAASRQKRMEAAARWPTAAAAVSDHDAGAVSAAAPSTMPTPARRRSRRARMSAAPPR